LWELLNGDVSRVEYVVRHFLSSKDFLRKKWEGKGREVKEMEGRT
jgi:hypothetical protein